MHALGSIVWVISDLYAAGYSIRLTHLQRGLRVYYVIIHWHQVITLLFQSAGWRWFDSVSLGWHSSQKNASSSQVRLAELDLLAQKNVAIVTYQRSQTKTRWYDVSEYLPVWYTTCSGYILYSWPWFKHTSTIDTTCFYFIGKTFISNKLIWLNINVRNLIRFSNWKELLCWLEKWVRPVIKYLFECFTDKTGHVV